MRRSGYAIDPRKLGKMLGISEGEQDILLSSAEHPYHCRCARCAKWWKLMGPDPATKTCGPFTLAELGLKEEDYPDIFEEEKNDYL